MVFSRPIVLSYIASSVLIDSFFFYIVMQTKKKSIYGLPFHKRNHQLVIDTLGHISIFFSFSRGNHIGFRIFQINL